VSRDQSDGLLTVTRILVRVGESALATRREPAASNDAARHSTTATAAAEPCAPLARLAPSARLVPFASCEWTRQSLSRVLLQPWCRYPTTGLQKKRQKKWC
jgi:hypothetical protein